MTIGELLDSIKSLDLVLPEFQREYVWEKEQPRQLLVSAAITYTSWDNYSLLPYGEDAVVEFKLLLDGAWAQSR